ncbi:hypothetical protein LCGC14_0579600 [marine sediment metagenome]|uniref:Uncharacterized protein n=1 Tax=marine sediment metagenome TaxID=412755 RepID=A0A0F9UPX6_9ZZZZ
MRVIQLPAINKTVSLANYIKGIKKAKANPEAQFTHGLTCWCLCSGAEIMHQFYQGIQDRINDAIPYSQRR